MNRRAIIKQLKDIQEYSRDCVGDNTVWNDDIVAIDSAIEIINSKENEKEKCFWIGLTIGVLGTLAFHFAWMILGGC